MARALKSTGVATKLSFCLAVDDDNSTIKEFVSSGVDSAKTVHANVTVGSGTWQGATVPYFATSVSGSTTYGVKFGATKPANNIAAGQSVGVFFISLGSSAPTGIRGGQVIGSGSAASGLTFTRDPTTGAGQLRVADNIRYTGSAAALPTDGTTKFSAAANYTRDSSAQVFYGLDGNTGAAGLQADGAAASPGGFGSSSTWAEVGGQDGQGGYPTKFVLACAFTQALTEAEYQSLHDDPFGTLFEAAASAQILPTAVSQLILPRSALAAASSHSFRRFG